VNMNFRNAPEAKVPCGIDDSYAGLKWVMANAEELGIDANRIAIMGESGGAAIVGGVSIRLAQAGEGRKVKFQAQSIPMVSNMWLTKPDEFF